MDVAVLVDPARVARVNPFAAEPLQIALVEPLLVLPESAEGGGCQWKRQHDVAHLAARDLVALVIDNPGSGLVLGAVCCCQATTEENIPHIEAGHGLACAAGLDAQRRVIPDACLSVLARVRHQGDAGNG